MEVIGWLGQAVVVIIAILLIISTIFGLPGNFLLVVLTLVLAVWDQFQQLSWGFVGAMALAWLIGEGIEFFASAIGAKQANASRPAIIAAYIGAFVGMIIGTVFSPVIGTLIGSLLGAFCAGYGIEYRQTGSGGQAKTVALYVVLGQLLGLVFKLALGLAMAVALIVRL